MWQRLFEAPGSTGHTVGLGVVLVGNQALACRYDCDDRIGGGVQVNYHTLSDFRVEHGEGLDDLLTDSVASLMAVGTVSLKRVAQDGMRVRASAGVASFRGKGTLERCLEEARASGGTQSRGRSRTILGR